MKTLTIGFSRSKKKLAIGSWLIRWYLGEKYSHTYLRFRSDKFDRNLIYEAVGSGVRFIGQKMWQTHAEEMKSYEIEVSEIGYIKIMQLCIDNAGADYGVSQNLGIIIADILNLARNPFPSNTNCSEELAKILDEEGYKFDKEFNLVTPKDIDNSLKLGKQ